MREGPRKEIEALHAIFFLVKIKNDFMQDQLCPRYLLINTIVV